MRLFNFKNLKISELHPQNLFEEKFIFFLKEWFSDEKKVKIQTSGSTGKPKILEVEKSKMINSAKMTCDFLKLKEGDLALICLPLEYISGKMMVVRAIERKLKLQISNPSTKPLENLENEIDFCAMTPLQVQHSLDKIHFIKNLIIGGAQVSENLKKEIFNRFIEKNEKPKTKIYETYGMSETLSHIALKQIYPNPDQYFKTLEDVEISVDERSCLKIFAPKLNSEILQTNDWVEIINHKEFKYLGRTDHVINSGGAKIFPEELETLVRKTIENEIVFVGIPDAFLGQKLVLVVEGLESDEINHQLSTINYEKPFQKPKNITFVEKLPRTPNGKIDRIGLIKSLKTSIFPLPSSDL